MVYLLYIYTYICIFLGYNSTNWKHIMFKEKILSFPSNMKTFPEVCAPLVGGWTNPFEKY